MKRALIATCLAFGLIAGVGTAEAKTAKKAEAVRIVDGPRVEGTGGTWAVIAWSTNVGGSSVVRYGTDANHLSQTAESPYARSGNVHRVRVKNLQPNTTYYFVVDSGQGSGTGTETKSQVAQFVTKAAGATSARTAPASGAGTPANKAALPQSDVRRDDDDSATARDRDNDAKNKGKHKGKRKHHKHKAGERDQEHDNDHDQDDQPR